MPTYINPNQHPVVVSLSEPRVSVTVWPESWLRSRLPKDAKQLIELDDRLASELVRCKMLSVRREPVVQADGPTAHVANPHPMAALDPAAPVVPPRVVEEAPAQAFTTALPNDEDFPAPPAPKPAPAALLESPALAVASEPHPAFVPKPVSKNKRAPKVKLPPPVPTAVPRRRFYVAEE